MRGSYEVIDEAISGCLTRLPRRFAPRKDGKKPHNDIKITLSQNVDF
ncbi:hypothetical protein RFEPED_1108 [Rickettsia felis str. Pedreira]|uniref:Uncharacterized protein n=1 Tax=Rickettsia felis str. Pedreira TaxID=1359196 RepID=A0A0F3MST0_RICFI|nr:hypothetical protein [Rickettsia felis]KJV58716.1 hypothetical protein RFEPED_1108 [Rickettsia felis str. Pedreira]